MLPERDYRENCLMKSPWQIGMLAVAISGVSVYDIIFFSNRISNDHPPISIQSNDGTGMLIMERLNDPNYPAGMKEFSDMGSSPVISLEELQIQGEKAYIPEQLPAGGNESWPARDPFNGSRKYAMPAGARQDPLAPEEKASSPSSPSLLKEPLFKFSGTLIERHRRFALIDGDPQPVGAQLGVWHLARIETDYIILQAGVEIRRIELNGAAITATNREDPL
jgi:hypothetical protein